ncbi:MAG TPA: discoidin domain-containing protein [Amycolatopsis sp.]
MRGQLRSALLAAVAAITAVTAVTPPAPAATGSAPVVLSVAPSGQGGDCSALHPCGLFDAQRVVRGLVDRMRGDVVVQLAGGTYRLDRPLELTDRDSGQHGHRVIWQAAPGARPVLSGAGQVTGWRLADPAHGVWSAPVPKDARSRQLYVNGARAPIAQGPAPVALTRSDGGYTAADTTFANWRNPQGIEFVFTRGNGDWTESRCRVGAVAGTHLTMQQPCWDNVTNRPKPPLQAGAYFPDLAPAATPTRLENAYELLHPGQWYLDESAHRLDYVPPAGQDPNRADIELPRLQTLLSGTGTLDRPIHDVTVRGLQFSYATWNDPSGPDGFAEIQANLRITGDQHTRPQGTCTFTEPAGTCPFGANAQEPANVTWRAAKGVSVEDNTFTHLGAAGLAFAYGSQDNLVRGNVFSDISGIGVMLGSSNDPHPADVGANDREINLGNRIEDNYLTHVGADYSGADGIFLFFTRQTTVVHNEIAFVPWDGIDSGANAGHLDQPAHPDLTDNINADNTISANLVHDFHQMLADGGAIYLEGHQGKTIPKADGSIDEEASFAHGTDLDGNVVFDDLNSGLTLYNDIGSQWITWTRNLEFNNSAGNGGCFPIGHIRFQDNYHADPIAVYPCGDSAIDLQYSNNHQLPLRPAAADMPRDVLTHAGLEAAFRHLAAADGPKIVSVTPRSGPATGPTEVLVIGSGFTTDAAVDFGGTPANAVTVLSPSFLVATAPAGAITAEATVRTPQGAYSGPSGLPLASVTADSMDDEAFWNTSFYPYNLLDGKTSTFWSSAASPMPHWIEVHFTRPLPLGKLVVQTRRLAGAVIPDLTISASSGGGAPQVVGTVRGNSAQDIPVTFDRPVVADTVRIQVDQETYNGSPRANADLAGAEFYDASGTRLGR